MECPYCKSIISDGSTRCGKCGVVFNYQNTNLYYTDNLKNEESPANPVSNQSSYAGPAMYGNTGQGPVMQPQTPPNYTAQQKTAPKPAKESKLGIWALVLTGLICTFPVGAILSLIDVFTKDGKKKTCSIIALSLCGIFTLCGMIGVLSDDDSNKTTEKKLTTEKVVETEADDNESEKNDNSGKLEEEKKTEETTASTEMSEEDYQAQCISYDYEDIMRTPKDFEGKFARFEGTVVQVEESEAWFSDDVNIIYRVAEGGDYDKIWYVEYTRTDQNESRILEDDYVTIFGECDGVTSYVSVLGSTVTIPKMKAEYIYNGKVDLENGVVTFDKDTITQNLGVTEYTASSSGYYDYYLVVENTSEFDLDINATVKFYDAEDNLVGAADATEYAVGHGNSTIMEFDCDNEFNKAVYELNVAQPDTYNCVDSDVEHEITQSGDKLLVTVKNIGSRTISNVTAEILFFSGGNVVGSSEAYFGDMDYELKPGDEVTEEITCYEYFDDYKIYVHASNI